MQKYTLFSILFLLLFFMDIKSLEEPRFAEYSVGYGTNYGGSGMQFGIVGWTLGFGEFDDESLLSFGIKFPFKDDKYYWHLTGGDIGVKTESKFVNNRYTESKETIEGGTLEFGRSFNFIKNKKSLQIYIDVAAGISYGKTTFLKGQVMRGMKVFGCQQ